MLTVLFSCKCPAFTLSVILRYSEEGDAGKAVLPTAKTPKPIKRVKPNATKSEAEEYLPDTYLSEGLGSDDSVQTYFTEGTPLIFSTATSLTDLRDQGASREAKLGTQQEVHGEEEQVTEK